jgi:hypothetical protein
VSLTPTCSAPAWTGHAPWSEPLRDAHRPRSRPRCDQIRRSGRPAGSASTLKPWPDTETGADVQRQVRRLGPNSDGEELAPGAVTDCSLGLLVDQPLAATLPTSGSLLVVSPTALLDARVRQPDSLAVYDLVTGHPARAPRALVFCVDLVVELREWRGTDWTGWAWTSRGWCWPAAARSGPAGTTGCRPRMSRRWAGRRWTAPGRRCAAGCTSSTCAGCIPRSLPVSRSVASVLSSWTVRTSSSTSRPSSAGTQWAPRRSVQNLDHLPTRKALVLESSLYGHQSRTTCLDRSYRTLDLVPSISSSSHYLSDRPTERRC